MRARWRGAAAVLLAAASVPGGAIGQDQVVNFRKPILVVETGGHSAPVRELLWSGRDGLYSGGLDKVVRRWDLADESAPPASLRPMVWRGPAGAVLAMALGPRPGEPGRSLLAVAGHGVDSRRGDITVYRVPGDPAAPTGEVVARLMPPLPPARTSGHVDAVLCLAFNPAGTVLASGSGGTDPDRRVILWDTSRTVAPAAGGGPAGFAPLRSLVGHTRAVRRLAFLPPDGARLVTAGEDGTVRLWDVATGRQIGMFPDVAPPQPGIVNALGVSPDGRTVVVGLESGALASLDVSAPPRMVPTLLPVPELPGPVESIAFHPDGRRFAVSRLAARYRAIDLSRFACDVEVRAFPGGAVTATRRVPGLVYACAFSPDGTRLAYSGGLNQSVFVQDVADFGAAPRALAGRGSTPLDLGFGPDDRVVGFTRSLDPRNPPELYEGFEPATRKAATVRRDDLRRAIAEHAGWTLTGDLRTYTLEAVHADGRRWRPDLDPSSERLWWSWTMVPPGPGHPRATVAIGCETGVAVYDLETGRRTRFYAGHKAAVVSVVPSRDGHWLASAGLDQVIHLYPLAGCDTRPGLGATFDRDPAGAWRVATVAPDGFAAAMGLMAGDTLLLAVTVTRTPRPGAPPTRVERAFRTPDELAEFVGKVADETGPNESINVRVRRAAAPGQAAGAVEPLGTSKRDNPALSLMQDVGREWVFWTPQGYYDTSIEGDSRLLGWHVNPAFDDVRPTDYVPVATYKDQYRPEVLERLWRTRSLAQALTALPPRAPDPDVIAADALPPKIVLTPVGPGLVAGEAGAPWKAGQARARVRLSIEAAGPATLGSREVVFDERLILAGRPIGPGRDFNEEFDLDLPPGRRVRLLVKASNDRDASRAEAIDLEFRPPAPAPEPPPRKLFVLGLGVDAFADPALPPIPYAGRDARGLSGFLADHLVTVPGARPSTAAGAIATEVLVGPDASGPRLRAALDGLAKKVETQALSPGDVVAVVVASHVLAFPKGDLPGVAPADAPAKAEAFVPAADLSALFGRLTDYGCRVVLFLDGVHPGELPEGLRADVKGWVRDLQRRRRVVTFVASKEGPNGVSRREERGLFALGVLNAPRSARASGAPGTRSGAYTLEQFRRAVERDVLERSERQQESDCFLPPGVPPWAPFFVP